MDQFAQPSRRNANAGGQPGESEQQSSSTSKIPEPPSTVKDGERHGRVDLTLEAQRYRLLNELRKHPVTTFFARKYLEVWHPAARIQELKARGHRIDTVRVRETSDDGVVHHNVAKYVLQASSLPAGY